MWQGGSYSGNYLDDLETQMYNFVFFEADHVQQIYRDQGLFVPEYGTNNTIISRGDNHMTDTHLGEYSERESDEALARRLQAAEYGLHDFPFHEQPSRIATTARGTYGGESSFSGAHGGVQDDVNLDNMTYEQITELGNSVGAVRKGLTEEQMSLLPTHQYKGSSKKKNKSADDDDLECVICKMQYEKGDVLMTLPCAHKYHVECITSWLKDDKSCCVCKVEVAV